MKVWRTKNLLFALWAFTSLAKCMCSNESTGDQDEPRRRLHAPSRKMFVFHRRLKSKSSKKSSSSTGWIRRRPAYRPPNNMDVFQTKWKKDYWTVPLPAPVPKPWFGKMNMIAKRTWPKTYNNIMPKDVFKPSRPFSRSPYRPGPRPNGSFMRPPYRNRPISPPTTTPTMAPFLDVSTDFSTATPDNPFVLFALAPPGAIFNVDLTLPSGNVADAVYLIANVNVDPGATCPPAGGTLVPTPPGGMPSTLTLEIDGTDQIIALCVDNVVVALSYYVFEDFSEVGGSGGGTAAEEFPDAFVEFVDFTADEPVSYQFDFGPGTNLDGTGTIVLYGSTPTENNLRRLNTVAFYVAPSNAPVRAGESCPLPNSEFLPPDDTFPLTLFILGGTQNRTVYACGSSVVVGVVEFEYAGPAPSLPPSIPVSAFPSLIPAPTVPPGTVPTAMPSQLPLTIRSELPSPLTTTQPISASPQPSASPLATTISPSDATTTQSPSELPTIIRSEMPTTIKPSTSPLVTSTAPSDTTTTTQSPSELPTIIRSETPTTTKPSASPLSTSTAPSDTTATQSPSELPTNIRSEMPSESPTVTVMASTIPSIVPTLGPTISLVTEAPSLDCTVCQRGCIDIEGFYIVDTSITGYPNMLTGNTGPDYFDSLVQRIEPDSVINVNDLRATYGANKDFTIACTTTPFEWGVIPFPIGSVGMRDNFASNAVFPTRPDGDPNPPLESEQIPGQNDPSQPGYYSVENEPPYSLAKDDYSVYQVTPFDNPALQGTWTVTCQVFCQKNLGWGDSVSSAGQPEPDAYENFSSPERSISFTVVT